MTHWQRNLCWEVTATTTDSPGRQFPSASPRPTADELFPGSAPVSSAEDLMRDGIFDDDEIEGFLADLYEFATRTWRDTTTGHPGRRFAQHQGAADAGLIAVPDASAVGITFVTLSELTRWAVFREWGSRRRAELDSWLSRRPVLPYSDEVAKTWGEISAHAARRLLGPSRQ
jgi:hypothetical protein